MSKTLVTLAASIPALQIAYLERKKLVKDLRDDGFVIPIVVSNNSASSTTLNSNNSSKDNNLLQVQLDDLRIRHASELDRLSLDRINAQKVAETILNERLLHVTKEHEERINALQRDHISRITAVQKEGKDEVDRLRAEMQQQEFNLLEGKNDLEGTARRQRDVYETELATLKNEREMLEKRLLTLQENVSSLSYRASSSEKQVEEISAQLVKVSNERIELKSSLEAALQTSSTYEQSVESLTSRLRILEAEVQMTRLTASSEATTKDAALLSAKKAMEEEMESLRVSLASSQKSEASERIKSTEEKAALSKELELSETKRSNLIHSFEKSQAELVASRNHSLELEELLSKSHSTEKLSRVEIEKNVSEITKLNESIEMIKTLSSREKAALNDELLNIKRDAKQVIEEKTRLEEELQRQKMAIKAFEIKNDDTIKAFEIKTNEFLQLESHLKTKESELVSLKLHLETFQEEKSTLSSELVMLNSNVSNLSHLLDIEKSSVKSLTRDLQTEKEKVIELDQAKQHGTLQLSLAQETQKKSEQLFQRRLDEYESTRTTLLSQLSDLNTNADLRVLNLQEELKKMKEEVDEKIKSFNDEVTVLKKSLDESQNEVAIVKKSLDESHNEVTVLKKSLDESQNEVAIVKKSLDESQNEVTVLKKSLDESHNEVTVLKKSLDRSSSLATNQALEIDDALSEKTAAQEKVVELEKMIQTIKAENATTLETIKAENAATLVSTSEVLNKKLQVVVKEFKALRQARESDEAARQLAVASASDTRIACDRLKTRLRASEDAVTEATKAAKESSEKCSMFETELRQVRVSLRESQAAREFAEEKSSRAEREAADLKSKVEFDAQAKDVASVWNEVNVTEPAPRMTIDDPAVGLILQSLTSSFSTGSSSDDARLLDLWNWFKGVSSEKDVGKVLKNKPKLELERVPFDVRANLLTLLVPLLKAKTHVDVKVYMRERQEVRSDIRLVVEDKRFIGDVKDAVNAGKTMAKEWRSNG
jgi:chromosome segregation ATPase